MLPSLPFVSYMGQGGGDVNGGSDGMLLGSKVAMAIGKKKKNLQALFLVRTPVSYCGASIRADL